MNYAHPSDNFNNAFIGFGSYSDKYSDVSAIFSKVQYMLINVSRNLR